jgi:hypothetical protein
MKIRFLVIAAAGVALSGIAARRLHIPIRGNLVAIHDVLVSGKAAAKMPIPVAERLVAHAGGAVDNRPYTNSRESLDQHYRDGYRIFELDFAWTADDKLVLTHDWSMTSSQFCVAPHTFTFTEFITGKRCDGLTQMTFDDLRQWMLRHPDTLVVTDTKDDNGKLFSALRASGADVLPQMVIQIYSLAELEAARELHPRAVWMTVYKRSYPAWALRRVRGVDAIVIPVTEYKRYFDESLMRRMPWYVHSVGREKASQVLRDLHGIYGVFVD